MKRFWLAGLLAVFALILNGLLPGTSSAVPSFARQKGKACTDCHTIWPRLNSAGREFKELGYTDVGENIPRIQEDNLDLLLYGPPISLSIIALPYSKETGKKGESRFPEEVALFFAGRITPNIGAFIEPKWDRDSHQFSLEFAKVTGASRVGESNIAGLTLSKGDVASADPYNTIRFTAYHTLNAPAFFFEGSPRAGGGDLFSFASTENEGATVHFKMQNGLFLEAGIFRGDDSVADTNSDPLDGFGRIAFEYALTGESIASLGGFYYGGQQRYDHSGDGGPAYDSDFNRYGVDFQYQLDSIPHLFEVVAVFMGGRDDGVWDGSTGSPTFGDVEFNAFYGEVSYFYDRKYGVTLGYDYMDSSDDKSLNKKGPTLNVTYMPWLNTKLGLEESLFDIEGADTQSVTNVIIHLYF